MTYALGRGSSKNEHNEQVMPLILSTCTQSAGTLKFPFLNPLLHEQCEMRWISYINYNRIIFFIFYLVLWSKQTQSPTMATYYLIVYIYSYTICLEP